MLSSNSWGIYRKTFGQVESNILRGTVDRKYSHISTDTSLPTDDTPEDDNMAHRSRTRGSVDSGYATTISTLANDDDVVNFDSPKKSKKIVKGFQDRALFANPEKTSLLSATTRTDLTDSIGTQLSGIQIENLTDQQLDELALLVAERGVVFFRHQGLTQDALVRISEHLGQLTTNSTASSEEKAGEVERSPLVQNEEWLSDSSFEFIPPSYSLLKVGEAQAGTSTAWVSQYGLYDALSKHMRGFLDDLHAVHSSRAQNPNSPYTENQHPAVRTHPVTGLRALNVTPGTVTSFAELKKKESDNLLQFLDYHFHSTDFESVRFKWEAGSVAIWDNRCTAYKTNSSSQKPAELSFKTTIKGEKPYFDPKSESRDERVQRLASEKEEETRNLAAIKARFNNTPMRRLIARQVLGEEKHLVSRIIPKTKPSPPEYQPTPEATPSPAPQTTDILAPRDPNKLESRAQRTQRWAKEVGKTDAIVTVTEKTVTPPTEPLKKAEVKFNVTPLRRIIQRQVSGNSGPRRRDWR